MKFALIFQSAYQSISNARSLAVTPGAYRGRAIEFELEEQQAGAERIVRRGVDAELVGNEVGVRQEVLARDFTLPPLAPVVEAEKQRDRNLVGRRRRIVALEEGVAVGQLRLPGTSLSSYPACSVHAFESSASLLRSGAYSNSKDRSARFGNGAV